MSRAIGEDFERIKTFFENYSLNEITTNPSFNRDIKCLHRKLYSLMVFSSEVILQNKSENTLQEITIRYINETVSDIVLALFCWVHGAYKPANLQLRSCIENFFKSVLYESTPTIIIEKSVYKIFNIAKEHIIFKNDVGERHYNNLSNYYSKLCQIAHGEINSLSEIDALVLLPNYDNNKSSDFISNFIGIIETVLAMNYFIYYENVYKMHEFNLDLFLQGIKTEFKKEIIEFRMESS